MNSFVIDSSVYIARFNKKDVFHSVTKRFFLQLEKVLSEAHFFMPSLVLFEVANYFCREGNLNMKKTYERFERAVLKDLQFTIDILDFEFLFAFRRFIPKVRLKTSDAAIACSAAIHNAVLVSWDKRLLKNAKPHVAIMTPREFLKRPRA